MRKLVCMLALTLLVAAPTFAAVPLDADTMQSISGGCPRCGQKQFSCAARPCAKDGVTNICSTCQGLVYHYYCISSRDRTDVCYTVVKPGGCGSWIWDGACRTPFLGRTRCYGTGGTPDDNRPCSLMEAKGSKC